MKLTTRNVYQWLERRHHDYQVEPEPLHGTYGLIWFLKGESGSFAVKTVAPERLVEDVSRFDADYLRREFRIWLALPPTYNVLPAFGFDIATLGNNGSENCVHLPVMRMPRRAGSLQDWVDSTAYCYEDRLVALAQAFNGLLYLYEHGIEGHGDLKPSNILYDDLKSLSLPEEGDWPSRRCPWRIQIADLGWADAWVDLGFTNKAQRHYLAPERMDKKFVPALSDVFSMGVIAAEVLQGHHPCLNLPKAVGSEGKWRRWIEGGERDLTGVTSPHLREMILQCLRPNAAERPTPSCCLNEICNEIQRVCGYSITATLELWRRPAIGDGPIAQDEHAAWAAAQSIKLDEQQTSISRKHLEARLDQIAVTNFETCERWLALAKGLEKLLESDIANGDALAELRRTANVFLVTILGLVTPDDLIKVRPREDLSNLIRPFERFSEVTTEIARIAGVDNQQTKNPQYGLGDYALSAIAFGAASEARYLGSRVEETSRYLADAIRYSPQEPVPYYFRARWGHERALIRRVLSKEIISEEERQSWIADLKMVLALDPNWRDAAQLLVRIRTD
jgi:hypothetical protein